MNNLNNNGAAQAREAFATRDHGAQLPVHGQTVDNEIARINMRGASYSSMTIIDDLTCRVFREDFTYKVCVSAKDHPGFEGCDYEACGTDVVGMLAMNQMLEQMRADCEWLDSMPEGALLHPGQSVLTFLLTYIGTVFVQEVEGEKPVRLQRALDKIQNTHTAIRVGESIGLSETQKPLVSNPFPIRTVDEHHTFVNSHIVSSKNEDLRDALAKPVVPKEKPS